MTQNNSIKTDLKSLGGPVNNAVDFTKLNKFNYMVQMICKKGDKALDFTLSLIDNLKIFFDCKRIIIVPIEKQLFQMTTGQQLGNFVTSDIKSIFMHSLEFVDKADSDQKNLIAISRDFKHDERLDMVVESLIETQRIIFTDNKIGILIKNKKAPSFVI